MKTDIDGSPVYSPIFYQGNSKLKVTSDISHETFLSWSLQVLLSKLFILLESKAYPCKEFHIKKRDIPGFVLKLVLDDIISV